MSREHNLTRPGQIGPSVSEAKQLILQFVSRHIGAHAIAFQCVYGTQPHDLVLIEAPSGSTLAVSCDLMLLPAELAQVIVAKKLFDTAEAFRKGLV